MADDTLRLSMEVQNAGAIPNAMSQSAAAVSQSTAQMSASLNTLNNATKQSTDDIAEWAAALGNTKDGLSRAQLQTIDFGRALAGMSDETKRATLSTSLQVRGLASDVGVGLPRASAAWIASLQGVAPVMSAAFSVIAVVGLLEALKHIPEEFEKMVGAVTGWDESAKKAFADQIEMNREYLKVLDETLHAQHELAGDKNAVLVKDDIADKAKQVKAVLAVVAGINEEIKARKEYAESLNSEGTSPLPLPKSVEKGESLTDLKEQLKKSTEDAAQLGVELQRLYKIELPKGQLKQQEEETRNWFENLKKDLVTRKENERAVSEASTELMHKQWEAERRDMEAANAFYTEKLHARLKLEEEGTNQIEKYETEAVQRGKKDAEDFLNGQREKIRTTAEMAKAQLEITESVNDSSLKLHKITLGTWVSDELAALDKWRDAEQKVLLKLAEIERDVHGEESAEYRKVIADLIALDNEYTLKKHAIDNKAGEESQRNLELRARAEQRVFQTVDREFNSHVAKLIAGQEKLGDAIKHSWDGITERIIMNLLKSIEQHAIAAVLHTSIDATQAAASDSIKRAAGAKDAMRDAAKAARGAYTAVMDSGIPFPLDFALAAPAAAAAFAAVMAFGSFDRGGVVPGDMLAMVHKNEMVLDPGLSMAVQNMARGGGGSTNNNSQRAVHLQYTVNGDRNLALQQSDIQKAVKKGMRYGSVPSYP